MYIQIKDINVYYETYGSGIGIPIIMIHGWGPDHRMLRGCMEPIFQKLPDNFKRIYFDLPGMGKTKSSKWIDSTDKMLDFIMQFLDRIIPDENFIIVGKSYGGYLARGLVKHYSGKVKGLLLICPIAIQERQKKNSPPFKVLEKEEELDELLNEEEKQYFESINVIQTKEVWLRFKENVLPGLKIADNDYLNNCLGKSVPFKVNIDDMNKKYYFPTLMLAGRQDSCVGYSDLWKIVEIYPRASFIVLDKAGHNLEIEQPVLFNALVQEWLERILYEIPEK